MLVIFDCDGVLVDSERLSHTVLCEMLVQVGLYVQGLMQMVGACGREGHLELNATLPLIAHCLHEAIHCLANGAREFAEKCVAGIEAVGDSVVQIKHMSELMDHHVVAPAG